MSKGSRLSIKNWSHGFTTKWEGGSGSLNIDLAQDGTIRPRKGWSTFAGMVWQLWLLNQRYTRRGIQGDFTVRLPLKTGGFKYHSSKPATLRESRDV